MGLHKLLMVIIITLTIVPCWNVLLRLPNLTLYTVMLLDLRKIKDHDSIIKHLHTQNSMNICTGWATTNHILPTGMMYCCKNVPLDSEIIMLYMAIIAQSS